jgi:hypothetical protein
MGRSKPEAINLKGKQRALGQAKDWIQRESLMRLD